MNEEQVYQYGVRTRGNEDLAKLVVDRAYELGFRWPNVINNDIYHYKDKEWFSVSIDGDLRYGNKEQTIFFSEPNGRIAKEISFAALYSTQFESWVEKAPFKKTR